MTIIPKIWTRSEPYMIGWAHGFVFGVSLATASAIIAVSLTPLMR